MKQIKTTRKFPIPDGVSVSVKRRVVTVKLGDVTQSRDFGALLIQISIIENGKAVQLQMWNAKPKRLAAMRSIQSHICNMIKGVQTDYVWKMKLVYAHFPISLTYHPTKNNAVEIRNFLGEKRVRRVCLPDGVDLVHSTDAKDEIQLKGKNRDDVSRSAALIHQSALVRNKDIRKFLDGIYVSEKCGIPI